MQDLRKQLEKTPAKSHWARISLSHRHGFDIPLFSIHSEKSCGIGEYTDIPLLIQFAKRCRIDILQFLPLNDTGKDPSPYSAHSAFALNPIHLGIAHLPDADSTHDLRVLLSQGWAYDRSGRVDYSAVYRLKQKFLKRYFELKFSEVFQVSDYKKFVNNNSWLKPYAEYKAEFSLDYYQFVQFLCYQQLTAAKMAAEKEGILLKGDIPILVNRDSADVKFNPGIFLTEYSAGAPPDVYTPKGQNWGFPLYDWENEKVFDFWEQRLRFAEHFYHLYRIDHFVGFYRIWAIRKGKSAKEGKFIPQEEEKWIPQGRKIIEQMLKSSRMLPIAEDLGAVPGSVREDMANCGICGTKVMRWERLWEKDQSFIPVEEYPPLSMTTVSTHDSETLEEWWEKHPDDSQAFCEQMEWDASPLLLPEIRSALLHLSHHSGSLFHINLLQEYLPLVPEYATIEAGEERINIPGTVADTNWSVRIKPSLEELMANTDLQHAIQRVLD